MKEAPHDFTEGEFESDQQLPWAPQSKRNHLSSLISTDYGKSFHDISQSINHTFIKEEFGVSVGPGISVSSTILHSY